MILFEFSNHISCSSENKDYAIKIENDFRDCEHCSISVATSMKDVFKQRTGKDILVEIESYINDFSNDSIRNVRISNRKVRFLLISPIKRLLCAEYYKCMYEMGKKLRDFMEPHVKVWENICCKRDNLQQCVIDLLQNKEYMLKAAVYHSEKKGAIATFHVLNLCNEWI